jgi:hypothetical protein
MTRNEFGLNSRGVAVSSRSRRLWRLDPLAAILAVPLLLLALLVGSSVLRQVTSWPPAQLDQLVFLAILGISVLPVILMLVDLLAERGGRIGFRGLTLDFSSAVAAPPGYAVPHNIGVAGQPLTDSASAQILDALRGATMNDVVVIDLEDGTAWWETRLLVLLAGAVRLGRPNAVVFTATEAAEPDRFQGWAPPAGLFPLLLRSDKRYEEIYFRVRSWMRQWELVPPQPPNQVPLSPPWMQGTGPAHAWMLFDGATGLPNELGFEQLLQSELGQAIEMAEEGPKKISVSRLVEVFRPVLRTTSVDEAWPAERQVDAVLSTDDAYVAITRSSHYLRLTTRTSALAGLVRSLLALEAPKP